MYNDFPYLECASKVEEIDLLEFVNIAPDIRRVIDNTPTISINEIIQTAEPCDMISTYLRKDFFKDKPRGAYVGGRTLGLAQGGLFISSKFVFDGKGNNKRLIGYSANLGEDSGQGGIPKVEIGTMKHYLNASGGMILMRIRNLTPEQKVRILKYMKARVGLDYNSSALLTSAWNRFKGRFRLGKMEMSKKEAMEYKEPLICSTIMQLALISSGSKVKFSDNPLNVWPRDFIVSPYVQKIGKFIRH